MSHNLLNPGLISAYNSLTDKHLAGYFSNTRIRRHLQRAGLITRSGRIVPDKEYRQKLIQRAHQRHVRECLAQAIFHKVLEMERLHQIEIKRKLEEFARRERVHKIKVERSKRYEEDILRIMSPRPPTGVRGVRKQHSGAEAEQSESSESPGSSRPNTAPGKMQRPVRLKPLHGTSTAASHRHSSPYRRHNTQRPFNRTVDKDTDRGFNSMEVRNGVSPYCLPVINNFVTPVPPSTKRRECPVKLSTSSTHRGRRLRPRTSSSAADATEDGPVMRSSVLQSRVCVNMVYLGKAVHLSHDLPDMRDDVRVFQQHCGGENLCVYKGRLREGESFQFISRRHRGFPFSLTFFLNGLQVERLSSCCEFKHRKSSRIGGRHGHFAFSGVEAASPCYKCIIAMGLDKKPVPPPRRVKEDGFKLGIVPRLKVTAGADAEAQKLDSENTAAEMTETQDEPHEDRKAKDDYEEDFEADDEGPVEEEEDKEKESTSPKEEKGNESDASDSETDDDRKSRSGSSFSGSESDAEEVAEARAAEEGEHDKPEDEEEQVPEESPQVEAAQAPESEAKDWIVLDSTGQSTEIEICDTSGPSAAEGERRTEEPERANSVQEKLAEATKESHCSSEPELNNTSTETTQPGSSKSTDKETKETETSAKQAKVIEEAKIDERMAQEADKPEDDATKEPEDAAKVENYGTDQAASEVGKDLGEKDSSEETAREVKSSPVLEEPNRTDREEGEQEEQTLQREESLGVDSKPDETAEAESTQAMTGARTMEMKAEARDTQEAINAQVSTATDTPDNNEQQGESEKAESEKAEPEKAEQEKAEPEKAEPEKAEPESNTKDESKESCQVEVEMGGIEKERVESDLVDKDKTDEEGGAEKVVEGHKQSINEASAEEMGTDLNRNEQGKDEGDHLEEKHPHDENKAEEEEDVTDSNTDEKVDVAQKHPGDNPNKELEPGESDDVQNGDTSNIDNGETQQADSGVRDEPYQTLASQHLEPAIQKVEDQETCAESLKLEEKVESDKREREIVSEEDPKHNKMASENLDSNIQKEEAQETSAESLKVEENVELDKEVAEEDHKDLLNKSPASDDPDKKLVVENLNSAVQKEEEQVTIAEGLKLEENVKSDERVEDEDHKEILKNSSAADEVEKDHKNGVDYSDVTEVDVENGEVSVFAETKPPDRDTQKQATEQIVKHRDDEVEKLKKEKNENIGSDSNAVTSIDQNSTEIIEDLDATEKNNNVEETRVGSGENGDTEEASKASEEGASILLKPQVELSEPKEQKGTPEGLTTANSADLVTNWVTMHQTSKYFETFVEPLEEISDMNSQTSNMELTEVAQSKSPVEVVGEDKKGVESAGEESKEQETENETKDGTSERGSNQSQDRHKASTKDLAQVEESTVFPAPNVETGGNMEPTVIEGSLKAAQLNNNLTRTSITSSHRTITSVFQTVSGSLNEEKVSGQDVTVVPKTEELSSSLKVREDAQQNSENKEVTTNFMTSTLNSGTQEGSNENQSSIGEDKEVLKESDHIVSQEHLSSFSVDSSFALVAASNAVNGL